MNSLTIENLKNTAVDYTECVGVCVGGYHSVYHLSRNGGGGNALLLLTPKSR